MNMNALSVANYFIELAHKEGRHITQLADETSLYRSWLLARTQLSVAARPKV